MLGEYRFAGPPLGGVMSDTGTLEVGFCFDIEGRSERRVGVLPLRNGLGR